jgi:hypothetical protein
MNPAPLTECFPLTDQLMTRYLRRKAERLISDSIVAVRDHLCTTTMVVGWVRGDSGGYLCQLFPGQLPWLAWCPRGGIHNLTPPGAACSHPLALAGKWAIITGLWQPDTSLVFQSEPMPWRPDLQGAVA